MPAALVRGVLPAGSALLGEVQKLRRLRRRGGGVTRHPRMGAAELPEVAIRRLVEKAGVAGIPVAI